MEKTDRLRRPPRRVLSIDLDEGLYRIRAKAKTTARRAKQLTGLLTHADARIRIGEENGSVTIDLNARLDHHLLNQVVTTLFPVGPAGGRA